MTSSPESKPTLVRWRIVLLLSGFVFLAHFNRISMSVAGTEVFIGPGKLSEVEMGRVYSVFLLVYTIGMLPGGWLIDRIGPRRALTAMGLGLGAWAAITGALGWSGLSIVAMLVPLLIIRGLAGAASVPLHPGAARTVSLWLPLRERSTANGLITAGALVGIAFCYPLFGGLMEAVGWPAAFVLCGALLFSFAIVWHVLSTDRPAEHPDCNRAERDLMAGDDPPRGSSSVAEVLGLFRNRSLVLLTLSYGTLSYVQYLFFYWIEYYFKNELKVPSDESRDLAMIITLAMAAGMFFGGPFADRICHMMGHRWGCRLIAISGMTCCAAFSLLGLNTTDAHRVTMWFSLSFASLGMCEPIFWTTAPMLERKGGLACALVNTGGNGVGMLAPVVTPLLAKYADWDSAIIVAAIVCAIGSLLWLGVGTSAVPVHGLVGRTVSTGQGE
jgi:ACS family D-galactonate transporter-like MFS transporter